MLWAWRLGRVGQGGSMGRVLWAAWGSAAVKGWGHGRVLGQWGEIEEAGFAQGRCWEGGLPPSCPVLLASGHVGVISEGAVVSGSSRESGSAAVMSARPPPPASS